MIPKFTDCLKMVVMLAAVAVNQYKRLHYQQDLVKNGLRLPRNLLQYSREVQRLEIP